MVSHYPANFGGYKLCGGVFNLSQDLAEPGDSRAINFLGRRTSR